MPLAEARQKGMVDDADLRKVYFDDLKKKIDFDPIKKAKLKIAVDLLYGTGRDYLDSALKDAGCAVTVLHGYRDVLFGGNSPEPSEANLAELAALLRKGKFNIGLAVDGDADRFGVMDLDGTYINPNQILALALDYLCRTRGWKGGAARSIATSHLIDAVAKKHGIEVYETGVGFKFIGDLLVQGKIIFGGEESARIWFAGDLGTVQVITPKRSASPSTASLILNLPFLNSAASSAKFASEGSGELPPKQNVAECPSTVTARPVLECTVKIIRPVHTADQRQF